MNDKKFLILYAAHFINDFSISQYNKLKNELPEGYDIIWWLDSTCKDEKPNGIQFIEFPHYTILLPQCKSFINPMKYMEILYNTYKWFKTYDFYWIIEYDVYFSGNWNYFFNTVDKYDEDLVGSCFTKYNKNFIPISYSNIEVFNNLPTKIKSYISIYRISNKALNYISNYDFINLNDINDVRNHLYEIYIPTILYNNGYTILSLNSEKIIKESGNFMYDYSDINFVNYYDDCGFIDDAVNTFWWDKTFHNKEEMNIPNKLYTRYKP